MAFERGQRVEILNQDEGFENSFYPALVISQVSDKKYIVQYSTLYDEQVGDYNEFEPIREFRMESELRPTPPEVVVAEFGVGDKVDAYHKDGWWYGRIRNVKGGDIKKYWVYFSVPKEYLEFEFGDLRIHQVWTQGQWSLS